MKEWWEEYRKMEKKSMKEIEQFCSKINKERRAKVAINHKFKYLIYSLIEVKQFTSA